MNANTHNVITFLLLLVMTLSLGIVVGMLVLTDVIKYDLTGNLVKRVYFVLALLTPSIIFPALMLIYLDKKSKIVSAKLKEINL